MTSPGLDCSDASFGGFRIGLFFLLTVVWVGASPAPDEKEEGRQAYPQRTWTSPPQTQTALDTSADDHAEAEKHVQLQGQDSTVQSC